MDITSQVMHATVLAARLGGWLRDEEAKLGDPRLAILAAELGHTEQAVSLCGTAGVPAVDSAPATPGGSQPRDDLVSLQPSAMLPSAS